MPPNGQGGGVPPLTVKNLPKVWKKKGEIRKKREKLWKRGKSQGKDEKLGRNYKNGKVLSICPFWQGRLCYCNVYSCMSTETTKSVFLFFFFVFFFFFQNRHNLWGSWLGVKKYHFQEKIVIFHFSSNSILHLGITSKTLFRGYDLVANCKLPA